MKSVQSFFQTAHTVFASDFIYRANTVLGVLGKLVHISVPLFVWSALYGASGETVINGRTLGVMMIYVLISQTCMALVSTDFASTIEKRMRTGVIEYNFIRPISPRMIFVGEGLGQSLYALLLTGIPAVALAAVLISKCNFLSRWHICFCLSLPFYSAMCFLDINDEIWNWKFVFEPLSFFTVCK